MTMSDGDDYPSCPECGGVVFQSMTFTGEIRECDNCDWYDPDP